MAGAKSSSKLRWHLKQLFRKIWVRVTAFALLGILSALAGFVLRGLIPEDLPAKVGADSLESILQIIASSMLAVTTFSLSILTAAFASAGTTATPRAVHLLASDSTSQTVLATFIGAFLFSLVGIIILQTGFIGYGESGRLVLFAVTLIVIALIVVALLRWIDLLGELGRVGDTLRRIETAAEEALRGMLESPWLGANPLSGAPPVDAQPILSPANGYLQHVDTQRLSDIADDAGLEIYLAVRPGDFLHVAAPALHLRPLPADPEAAETLRDRLLDCLTIRAERNFDQDPLFGLLVLSEAAQRALSPGINDPGTARQAIVHILQVLTLWREPVAPEIDHPRLFVPTLDANRILRESLLPIGRDGAGDFWIHESLQNVLLALTRIGPQVYGQAAADLSQMLLIFSDGQLILEDQKARLHQLAAQIQDQARLALRCG